MRTLLSSWYAVLPPSAPPAAARRVGEDLLARWREPHRHYHTVDHLAAVLRIIEAHSARTPEVSALEVSALEVSAPDAPVVDAAAVTLAAWYHDAVYDPLWPDNEEASARLAEAALPELAVPAARVGEVARLVRLTASHDPAPDDVNGALLTDADLAILAAPSDAYAAYVAGVRREYANISDAAFAVGRAAVLDHLIGLPSLFHTPELRVRWEDAARRNLAVELATLRRDLGTPG